MKKAEELRKELLALDHKSYGAYKSLAGEYQFAGYVLCIDKVQGDPFAAPSRLRVCVPRAAHDFSEDLYDEPCTKIALEDLMLRKWNRYIGKQNQKAGSGNSGRLGVCHCGQEIIQRQAVVFSEKEVCGYFLVGFPARGRSILARELEKILFEMVPDMIKEIFYASSYKEKELRENRELAKDQHFIREELKKRNLVAFLGNGSILPRESGVSQRPLKDAIPFESPKSMEVTLQLPFGGEKKGMGIPKGVTVIVGGGYHGKSTLLEAIQLGVYNHIKGDGREYVITDDQAVKIRAEDGRSICKTNIQLFIDDLPNNKDTVEFCTENASGSTSQAGNMMEAIEAGTNCFLIDEDTSATNFMVRDAIMQKIVTKEKEPITPFISWVRALYEEKGISTIIVVGSSAAYLEVADQIIQLDRYMVKNIKEEAKAVLAQYPSMCTEKRHNVPEFSGRRVVKKVDMSYKGRDMKIKASGRDTIVLNKENIDVRYLEQLIDSGQTIAIGYMLKYCMEQMVNERSSMGEIVDALYHKIEKNGMHVFVPRGYSAGFPVMPRKYEVMAAWNRFRKLAIK